MKKILITGKGSYVGESFRNYINKYNTNYYVDVVSTINNEWETVDFSKYDVVYNVAGIAHVDTKPSMESLYYEVNRDMPIKIANRAKKSGVKQFIHMSSMIVYGNMSKIGQEKNIDLKTEPKPENFYGGSKLQADIGLRKLEDESFKVAIIRPPLIYSERAIGNFPRLIKLSKILPIFPDIKNKQSMIYIDNFCEFIKMVIDHEDNGTFYPQNKEYVSTTDMVVSVATNYKKKIYTTKLFNSLLKLLSKKVKIIDKAFGNLTYDMSISNHYDFKYCVVDFEESIKKSCANK